MNVGRALADGDDEARAAASAGTIDTAASESETSLALRNVASETPFWFLLRRMTRSNLRKPTPALVSARREPVS
jgi:hypothetical protein